VRCQRLSPALGARLDGIDVVGGLSDDELVALRAALVEHQVVVLSAPGLDPDDHLALATRLGEAEVHAFFPNLGEGYERISVLDSDDGTVASMWHTDESFLPEPPLGTVLHARILPAFGGDTCFASTTAAYAALSAPMQRYLDGLTAVHDLARTTEFRFAFGMVTAAQYAAAVAEDRRSVHPVVRTHPETGAKGLFVNPTYTRAIAGIAPDESSAILAYLYAHMIKERFVYRHRWSDGDLVLWDNRSTMHNALADFTGRRRMHRVSILGDRPV
jgi:taurine dioxygenase